MNIHVSRADVEAARKALKPLASMKETMMGRPIPQGWTAGKMDETTWWYYSERQDLQVLESVRRVKGDGKRWHHISVSHGNRLPDWGEMSLCKRLFMGHESTALQVLAPVSRWVNIHEYCLHLWRCMDGEVVPDFSTIMDGVRHV